MRTTEAFRQFYGEELRPVLAGLEARRKTILRRALIILLGWLGLVAVATPLVTTSFDEGLVSVGIIAILGLTFASIAVALPMGRYRDDFKRQIIRPIVHFLGEGLRYEPQGRVPESVYLDSQIFPRQPDRYRGDDLVRGRIDRTDLQFSEVHAEERSRKTDGKGGWRTIFRGLFFVADFHKNFRGTTLVLPDTAERLFGGFGQMLQSWNRLRGRLVKLEDPEFERLFVVYGDDQIEARYILSLSLMERISEFRRRVGREVYLSFVRSRVFVAVGYDRELFEPRLYRSILGLEAVTGYFEDLRLALGIVQDLNLNTRIWSKT